MLLRDMPDFMVNIFCGAIVFLICGLLFLCLIAADLQKENACLSKGGLYEDGMCMVVADKEVSNEK